MAKNTVLPPLAIVIAMMVLALSDNFIPLVAEGMSVWQYHALRSAMMVPLMGVVLVALGGSLWPRRLGPVVMRAVLAVLALLMYFSALPAVGISLAAAGMFTSPIFVVILSALFFGERTGPWRLAGIALGFLGVCLVLEVFTQPLRAMALVPMAGGALYALSIIWTRRYCQQESPGTMGLWNLGGFWVAGVLGMAATPWLAGALAGVPDTAFVTIAPVWPDWWQIGLVAAMGCAGATGVVLLAYGYRSADPSFAALFDYSFLFWVPLFAWLVQGQAVERQVALGMAMIALAGGLAILGRPRGPDAGAET